MLGWNFFFENYYPNSKVEGFYIKKLSLEFLIFLRHKNSFWKWKLFFRHKAKLLVHHICGCLWNFEICSWKSKNSILSIYFFVPWKHGIPCFLWLFQWNFKKFQILFFPYMKLQLLINNVFIIFDNCAFKIQNSKKTRIWTVSYTGVQIYTGV